MEDTTSRVLERLAAGLRVGLMITMLASLGVVIILTLLGA